MKPGAYLHVGVLAVFAVIGIAVLDDYGVSGDEVYVRLLGQGAISHALGEGGLPAGPGRYYGAAFEAPLILVERALGLTDSRAIHLSRRLLTHLFFLTGGFFCYLLVYRLFGDRWLALFALLLFLLHPRLYAHSFFNSKDLPFAAAFMIALYLAQRAFRRGTVTAFAACGVGVGALANLRVMGLGLFPAVLALLALDLLPAGGWPARRRLAAAAAAFAAAAAGTYYAISPWLWSDPFAIADAVTTLAGDLLRAPTLFQGEWIRYPAIPPHYAPTWMAITTPPATLLLCLIGAAAAIGRAAARPRHALGNTDLRFALLLLGCLALPIVAVAALRANLYNGWRHLYFLYAPACLLAVYGLRALLARLGVPARRGLGVLAAAALAGAAIAMVRLHPYQEAYFNLLVDRRTPERLRTQYQILYWGTEYREGLEYLLERYPDDSPLYVERDHFRSVNVRDNRLSLPAAARRRIVIADQAATAADFFIDTQFRRFGGTEPPFGPVLHARRIYRNTVLTVSAVDLSRVDQATADGYRAAWRAALAGQPLLRSEFDLYLDGRTLTYVKERCRPEDTVHPFVLRIAPVDTRRRGEWVSLSFRFGNFGVRFDGRCLIRRILPDYPIRALAVGRWLEEAGYLMEAAIDLPATGPPVSPFWREHREIAAGERGAPAARGAFDLYPRPGAGGPALTYHKEPCRPADLAARFFLHVFPADAAELPAGRLQSGFANRDFAYAEHGVVLGAACVALVPLPAYGGGIARIRTGQFTSGHVRLWSAEFPRPVSTPPPGKLPCYSLLMELPTAPAGHSGLDRRAGDSGPFRTVSGPTPGANHAIRQGREAARTWAAPDATPNFHGT